MIESSFKRYLFIAAEARSETARAIRHASLHSAYARTGKRDLFLGATW